MSIPTHSPQSQRMDDGVDQSLEDLRAVITLRQSAHELRERVLKDSVDDAAITAFVNRFKALPRYPQDLAEQHFCYCLQRFPELLPTYDTALRSPALKRLQDETMPFRPRTIPLGLMQTLTEHSNQTQTAAVSTPVKVTTDKQQGVPSNTNSPSDTSMPDASSLAQSGDSTKTKPDRPTGDRSPDKTAGSPNAFQNKAHRRRNSAPPTPERNQTQKRSLRKRKRQRRSSSSSDGSPPATQKQKVVQDELVTGTVGDLGEPSLSISTESQHVDIYDVPRFMPEIELPQDEKLAEGLYWVRRILDERPSQYLIQWHGKNKLGRDWKPSWTDKKNVGDEVVERYQEFKQRPGLQHPE